MVLLTDCDSHAVPFDLGTMEVPRYSHLVNATTSNGCGQVRECTTRALLFYDLPPSGLGAELKVASAPVSYGLGA